ncbi:L-glutamate gamma-semialdehyde dehydrogenase [Candidatus Marinimicrobia bacterium MT.SAG.2]|nr:L-glutamate gamma-semialdehyde dehydrogenase [Candidatus Marinimicrobia bacterium MT.SAG.2]
MNREQYKPTELIDFSDENNIESMQNALDRVKGKLGQTYSLKLGGQEMTTDDTFTSFNPGNIDEVIGHFQKAGEREADMAVKAASEAFKSWSRVSVEERANCLFKASDIMRERRMELAAWMVYEVGKSWAEADGDVAETIDFLEFYGQEALRYSGKKEVVSFSGESPYMEYIPLGVGIIIPPWNFPLAITSGMATAAIVSGNTIVLKPSSDAPATAYQLVSIMEEAGLPPGVLNYLTGPGALAGEKLVRHPKTRFISFTGSMEVGLGINKAAAEMVDGQVWIKRVVAEMGGKDAIIVDSEANLEEAAIGVVSSAFGYNGQKCSACSRLIVVEDVHEELMKKVVEKTSALKLGDPTERTNFMGPVVNESSIRKIEEYVEIGKEEGELLIGGERGEGNGYYYKPTIFDGIDRGARLAQEEIFGPVLAVLKAKDFDDALDIANDTIFGLTGAVYTDNNDKWEKSVREFHVGNLYRNRKCTGALVGVHPFGGFNMSGTDSKAGGADYLLLFQQAKSVSEKL